MPNGKLVIGVCAMDCKARSKPMRKILERLVGTNEYEVIIFGDKVIIDEDVSNWPICDAFVCFYSSGFPLKKAIEYTKLVRPFCINDLLLQFLLLDRRLVLLLLDAIDVPTLPRIAVSRDQPYLPEDAMDIVGRDFNIDFSTSLFPREEVIQIDADTIICGDKMMKKPFVEKPCDGEDHNIFIYYHSDQGGGVRKLFRKIGNKSSEYFPNIFEIRTTGSFVYEEFIQIDNQEDVKVYTVGLDYCHAETRKSPCVDGVVRRNADGKEVRYVTLLSDEEQDIARRVSMAFGQTICGLDLLRKAGKSYVIDVNGWSFVKGNEEYYQNCSSILHSIIQRAVRKLNPSASPECVMDQWKLKAFISVIRHADRTPKQKVKMILESDILSDFISNGHATVVKGKDRISQIAAILKEYQSSRSAELGKSDNYSKLEQILEVLAVRSTHADTKVQLKPIYTSGSEMAGCMIIAKWGGEFTHAGRHQCKDLGDNLQKELTLLNKKIMEDVQVFSSSERRAIATAQVFSKAFMPLAELPSDFVRINKEWLDDNFASKEDLDCNRAKILDKLKNCITQTKSEVDPTNATYFDLIQLLEQKLLDMKSQMTRFFASNDVNSIQRKWCCSETPILFKERWEKLIKEFCIKEKQCDVFKISEIYDSLKYDALHNKTFLEKVFQVDFPCLFEQVRLLFQIICPLEYGVNEMEMLKIGRKISSKLLCKIVSDLKEATSIINFNSFVRIFVTKESHMYTLLNLIKMSRIEIDMEIIQEEFELDYLSQIGIELYEKHFLSENSERCAKYSIRFSIAPGAHSSNFFDLNLDSKHSVSVLPRKFISQYLESSEVLNKLCSIC